MPESTKIKVFQLNDYEYWFGPNLETVLAQHQKDTGCYPDEILDPSYHELTEEELEQLRILPGEDDLADAPTLSGTELLKQELAEGHTCGYLCGSEA